MSTKTKILAVVALAILLVVAARAYQRPLVLLNCKVYRDGGVSDATTALIVQDGQIESLGSDKEAVALSRWDSKAIDLGGKLVLPGFIDAHVHPMFGAMMDSACQLQEVKTPEQLRDTLSQCRAGESREILSLGVACRSASIRRP